MSLAKTLKIGLSNADKATMKGEVLLSTLDALIDAYSSSATYEVGEYVHYGDKLYKCTTAITTAEAWNSAHWTESNLNDVIDDINAAVDSVDGKANIIDLESGTLVPAKSQVAEGLSTNVGTLDKTPFAYMTSGGQTDVETGYQRNLKLVGSTIVKNQWVKNPTFTTNTNWNAQDGTLVLSSGLAKFTATATSGSMLQVIPVISGHIYLQWCNLKTTASSGKVSIRVAYTSGTFLNATSSGYQIIAGITTANQTTDATTIKVYDNRESGWDEIDVKEHYLIDLTQMFGSNDVVNAIIGNDTSKQVANLMLFLGGWLPTTYDTGTLIPSKSAYLKSVMYNQWDEIVDEWNSSLSILSGSTYSNSNAFVSSYIRALGNTRYFKYNGSGSETFYVCYYDKDKKFISGGALDGTTSPINTYYLRFSVQNYGTTYNHDICVFIYWDGSKIAYEPYEQKIEPLPNIEINGILKVDGSGKVYADGDELYPDGTGKRRYGVVDLSTLTWTSAGSGKFYADLSEGTMPIGSAGTMPNMLCNKYSVVNRPESLGELTGDKIITTSSGTPSTYRILVIDTSLTGGATPTGTLIYELATETDITSTSFNENIFADDFGTLQFLDENNAEIVGLQGCEIFYKANVSGFAESLYVRTNGEPSDVVVQSEIADFVKQVDLSSGITDVAGLTYDIKKAYKIGNMVFLTLAMQNKTGSDISANATLFSLSDNLIPLGSSLALPVRKSGSIATMIIATTGNVNCMDTIANNQSIYLMVAYVVA